MTTKAAEPISIDCLVDTEFAIAPAGKLLEISKVAPRIKGFLRDIKFLWEVKDTSFYRVNYYDLKDENKIKRSLFVRVTPTEASIE